MFQLIFGSRPVTIARIKPYLYGHPYSCDLYKVQIKKIAIAPIVCRKVKMVHKAKYELHVRYGIAELSKNVKRIHPIIQHFQQGLFTMACRIASGAQVSHFLQPEDLFLRLSIKPIPKEHTF